MYVPVYVDGSPYCTQFTVDGVLFPAPIAAVEWAIRKGMNVHEGNVVRVADREPGT
jgi:hypothetical protein